MEKYDLVVIGAGGTGLAGGMYGARLGLKTLILGKTSGSELPVGGVIGTTDLVENYPGFTKISGFELAKKLEEHARSYDLVTIKNEGVSEIKKNKNFLIKTNKSDYEAKAILFATGTRWKKLDVPGAVELQNKGVNYCALCDGPLYKNKIVAVIGGSDSAAKDALILAKHAKKVYIIYRGEAIHPEPVNLQKVKSSKNIEIINNTNVTEVFGKERVEGVVLDKSYKKNKNLNLDAVFVAIGHEVLSGLAENLNVKLNNKKEIIINHKTSETNVSGVYAAGDVTDKQFKQLITGVADACTAAYSAYEFLGKEKVESEL
jgi:thioredoxin reductase (NADPH)